MAKNCQITIHDPYVKPNDQNLTRFSLRRYFTRDLKEALRQPEFIFICTAHIDYFTIKKEIGWKLPQLKGIFDGCNIWRCSDFEGSKVRYAGIGKGRKIPVNELVEFVFKGFRAIELGFANEIFELISFLNDYCMVDDLFSLKRPNE